jgi:Uma2 family endonuclease
MRAKNRASYISVKEYLKREERASVRHEYVDGRLFAMTGATKRHNIITSNLQAMLQSRLKGSSCYAYSIDVKVKVESTNSFYYPDVVVSCGDKDLDDVVVDHPVLVVEVLSRSTAATDRREKVIAYKQLNSLKDYMIVHQRRQRVELHSRKDDGTWEVSEFGAGEQLEIGFLPGGKLLLSMDDIYEGVKPDSDFVVHEDPFEDYDASWTEDW